MPLAYLIIALLLLLAGAVLYKTFLHSPKVDKVVKQMTDENYAEPTKAPRTVIKDIETSKVALEKQVKANEEISKKAGKQNEAINKYLGKEDVKEQEKDVTSSEKE